MDVLEYIVAVSHPTVVLINFLPSVRSTWRLCWLLKWERR